MSEIIFVLYHLLDENLETSGTPSVATPASLRRKSSCSLFECVTAVSCQRPWKYAPLYGGYMICFRLFWKFSVADLFPRSGGLGTSALLWRLEETDSTATVGAIVFIFCKKPRPMRSSLYLLLPFRRFDINKETCFRETTKRSCA